MNEIKTIKAVEANAIPQLKRTLTKFLSLNERIASEWEWKDFPWWYNERARLSVLAGAVWKSKGIAFEEFSSTKIQRKAKRSKTYTGRCDLYIKLGEKEYTVEAKNLFIAGNPTNGKPHVLINNKLSQAVKDVKKAHSRGSRRLAVLFVSPRFRWQDRQHLEVLINKWIEEIKKIHYTAAAWTFPKKGRTQARWKKNWLFPGVAIIIKKV